MCFIQHISPTHDQGKTTEWSYYYIHDYHHASLINSLWNEWIIINIHYYVQMKSSRGNTKKRKKGKWTLGYKSHPSQINAHIQVMEIKWTLNSNGNKRKGSRQISPFHLRVRRRENSKEVTVGRRVYNWIISIKNQDNNFTRKRKGQQTSFVTWRFSLEIQH